MVNLRWEVLRCESWCLFYLFHATLPIIWSEQRLASRAQDEEIVAKCTQMLLDNNPPQKENKENEAGFSKIEEGHVDLNNKLDRIAQMMEKFMN